MTVCGVCHSDDHTVYVVKTPPGGLSGRCAPVPISGCNWSRRFPWHVSSSVGLAGTLKSKVICCSEELAAVHETALNVGMFTWFPFFLHFTNDIIWPCVIPRLSVPVPQCAQFALASLHLFILTAHCSGRTFSWVLWGWCLTAVISRPRPLVVWGCILWPLAFEMTFCLVWITLTPWLPWL